MAPFLLGYFALWAVPLALIALCFRVVRRFGCIYLLCLVAYVIGFFISMPIATSIRMSAFTRLAERSTPLINAIHAYEHKYGRPPGSLQALTPEFIASVPTTGMAAYRKYYYLIGGEAGFFAGNPWVLQIRAPWRLSLDEFFYLPLQNYPKDWYGNEIERIGDWAYIHE